VLRFPYPGQCLRLALLEHAGIAVTHGLSSTSARIRTSAWARLSPLAAARCAPRRWPPAAQTARLRQIGQPNDGIPPVFPPSTGRTAPVMKLESSDSRKAMAAATSWGSPARPIG
jgi:hypothetical protein